MTTCIVTHRRTFQSDEAKAPMQLKVWLLDRLPATATETAPFCSRTTNINYASPATALCAHSATQTIIVGCADSSLLLYQGDVVKERCGFRFSR